MKSFFPETMMTGGELTMESIAAKLTYFHEQLHLLHWQTDSYAEHVALGGLYDYVHDFKDGLIEKLMGYSGRKITGMEMKPVVPTSSTAVVIDLMDFAGQLKRYGDMNGYHDVGNLADSLSGEAAKVKYLLTLT